MVAKFPDEHQARDSKSLYRRFRRDLRHKVGGGLQETLSCRVQAARRDQPSPPHEQR